MKIIKKEVTRHQTVIKNTCLMTCFLFFHCKKSYFIIFLQKIHIENNAAKVVVLTNLKLHRIITEKHVIIDHNYLYVYIGLLSFTNVIIYQY